MKTKEFINEVEALGYEVSYNWGTIYINRAGFMILDLDYLEEWEIDVDYPGFDEMRWDDKKELMTIVSEYMLTDPKDREEEKRYWLQKIPVPLLDKEGEKKWLWKYMGTAPSNMFGVDATKIDSELYKTIHVQLRQRNDTMARGCRFSHGGMGGSGMMAVRVYVILLMVSFVVLGMVGGSRK